MSDEERRNIVFSPVGERGPAGDTGHVGLQGDRGSIGLSGVTGPPGIQGPPGPTTPVAVDPRRSKTAQVLTGIGILFFGLAFILAIVFAWAEVSALRRRVDLVSEDRRQEQAEEDCLSLYRTDVSTAIGIALAANNSLWVSVASRPPGLTDEEQAAQNQVLGEALSASNQPLLSATEALDQYEMIQPEPDECPHPIAVARRRASNPDD